MKGLYDACKNGHLKVVKYLVIIGCDPKADNNHAIKIASENGRLEVVEYLLSIGCTIVSDEKE